MEKQKFIDYCQNKIFDLNTEKLNTKILMIGNIKNFGTCKVVQTDLDSENFTCLNENGEIVCDTPMLTPIDYALRLEFEKIDKEFYNNIIEYWEEIKNA